MDMFGILTVMPKMGISQALADAVKSASDQVDWSSIDQSALAIALLSAAGTMMQGTH